MNGINRAFGAFGNQRGVALPLAMVMLVTLTALMVAFAVLANTEPTIANNQLQTAQALRLGVHRGQDPRPRLVSHPARRHRPGGGGRGAGPARHDPSDAGLRSGRAQGGGREAFSGPDRRR